MDASEYVFKPFPGSSHTWALDLVRRLPPGPLRVLDVGAAEGHVLRAVQDARGGLVEAWAVEPQAPSAPRAPATWVTDLEQVPPTPGFDLVLALDVLEHVAEPTDFLAEIVARLNPGGALLLSVPNVAHWSVRALMAAGRFEYFERGILDHSHLRFFTRRSLLALLEQTPLEVLELSESIVPFELLLPAAVSASAPWSLLRAARRRLASAWPSLLAYQLLVHARRRA